MSDVPSAQPSLPTSEEAGDDNIGATMTLMTPSVVKHVMEEVKETMEKKTREAVNNALHPVRDQIQRTEDAMQTSQQRMENRMRELEEQMGQVKTQLQGTGKGKDITQPENLSIHTTHTEHSDNETGSLEEDGKNNIPVEEMMQELRQKMLSLEQERIEMMAQMEDLRKELKALIVLQKETGAIIPNASSHPPAVSSASTSQQSSAPRALSPGSRHSLDEDLLTAADEGKPGKVCELLYRGAYINTRDADQYTPLLRAARHVEFIDHVETVAMLLQFGGANVGAKGEDGETALHKAAKDFSGRSTKLLIGAGANVHTADHHGNTPLHLAAVSDNVEATRALIWAGADIESRNNEGDRPLDVAGEKVLRQLLHA